MELAHGTTETAVRDTKNRDGGVLMFGAAAFGSFLERVKTGRLDLGR